MSIIARLVLGIMLKIIIGNTKGIIGIGLMVVALVLPLRGTQIQCLVSLLLHNVAIAWLRCSVQCHYCCIALPLLGLDAQFSVATAVAGTYVANSCGALCQV